jgi:hypothetical protein
MSSCNVRPFVETLAANSLDLLCAILELDSPLLRHSNNRGFQVWNANALAAEPCSPSYTPASSRTAVDTNFADQA